MQSSHDKAARARAWFFGIIVIAILLVLGLSALAAFGFASVLT